ncbi:glycoside hydrolase family 5 protein [Aureobasidium subglaciale EXF-2481]|uniref:glucan 1,3-beta-glucosidase n=1 Tax=Aureobasidium subglaciale (strain EXF-2481) TaxID=1043005 RepID=A0A074YYD4_AURSE|nr:glycoside hydrolase family 5 protein [Aureobasidium subglaciale EXF-2481]KAI5207644.1 glycoside hydrolase [Aureobasidium subglaciale]KAI5226415.1 glycoside hydrolase [Aureobasidium subglaciale]KAI5229851.1 glycoside hydrolase [Aureobasidium subglaciale]KAI5264380.1 glycoside hydrolase [Aureobasidium subglaciale]KEQ99182.1 glycoside hydrolase family 5 protein [Aureobasidium subglaciale EXF-2481]
MFSLIFFAFACFAFLSFVAEALPAPAPSAPSFSLKSYYHGPAAWSPSATYKSTSTFPTLSIGSQHIVPSGIVPSGYLASGFHPTASGYAWPTGTGFPSGVTGYPQPTGTGLTNATAFSSWWTSYRQSSSQALYSTASYNTTTSVSVNSTTVVTSASFIASSTSVAASSTAPASTGSVALPDVLRGVNIGGWLILESWMNWDVFADTDAKDQYSFDSCDGAKDKLEQHWASYFTESDVEGLAAAGINAVRIPIGFWSYVESAPYITGADAYLEKAIGWCRDHGIKVLVDCHGSPGSQNGFDNSGRSGTVAWQQDDNMDLSISILETIAKKYGAQEYADVVFGIQLVNEPISWDQNNIYTTKEWAKKAYTAVKSASTNQNLAVIMHDAFESPSEWQEVGSAVNGDASLSDAKFWIDTHLYQNMVADDSKLTQDEHIAKACNWQSTELLPSSSNLPVIVGEFSAATNICANPDGSTVAGNVCWIDGCQCSANVNIEDWNEPLIAATRKFLEAELDTFEAHARGYFMWNFKGPGAWGYQNAIKYGLIGDKITDRKYPGQCSA